MTELAELLERFRRGPELLAVATTGAAGTELDFTPEGKWSVRQIVCHLADAEATGTLRFRQVIAEDHPVIPGWNLEAWVTKLGYEKRKISQMLELFRVLRSSNYELLKDLPEDSFRRTATHPSGNEVSLLDLLRMYAEHVEKHVMQLQAARIAYREHKAKTAVH